jgi:hypothetical protein
MLTVERFRATADSYGADLQRWPNEMRDAAEALLNVSAEARAVLQEARALDEAINAASATDDARRWRPGEQNAALARLRSGVEARIAPTARKRLPDPLPGLTLMQGVWWATSIRSRLVGMAAAGGCAIVAGLLLGSTYVSEPATDGALTMLLQPAPIHILSD